MLQRHDFDRRHSQQRQQQIITF